MGIKVLSLFDGMSCGQIALERAGIEVDTYYASEIDEHAIAITKKNYPDTVQLGDIIMLTNEKLSKLGKIDLLIGGSPCQDLSSAKDKRKGLDGEKSKLFFEYTRVLEKIKPKYFFYENVGSMRIKDKDVITSLLGVESIEINSNLVSAQNRVRNYWTNINKVEHPKDKSIILKNILEDTVDKKYFLKNDHQFIPSENKTKTGLIFRCGIISSTKWINNDKVLSRNFRQGNRVYSILGKSTSINATGGGLGGHTGLYYLEDSKPFSKHNIRRLTPLESERLQTVPEGYTEGVRDTHRLKMLGNGWTVDVIAHILSFMELENTYEIYSEVEVVKDTYIEENNYL